MQRKSDLYVITKVKDLAKYIITVTEKSPKKFRFTLVTRLQNYVLDCLEMLLLANAEHNYETRLVYQDKARSLLSLLGYFAEIASDQECILFRQYEQISKQLADCLLYLGRWIASTTSKMSSK